MGPHELIVTCAVYGTAFSVSSALSVGVLSVVNWRPWRLYSYVIMRQWPMCVRRLRLLSTVSGLMSCIAWGLVLSPLLVLVLWGVRLLILLEHDTIGLAIVLPGTSLLLAFYAIMLWWRTRWQSSRAVAVLLLVAVALLCAYEIAAVYLTAGRLSSKRYSASGLFFGFSAICLAINMLFICKMVFNDAGLDIDEYVRRSYKYAYADSVEVGRIACLPEPPDLKDFTIFDAERTSSPAVLYAGSIIVLAIYSLLYGLIAKEARWLGGITSAAVLILDANIGACLFGFELLNNRVVALFLAGIYRVFLICFGVHYWYLGHCISFAVVASVLLGAGVRRHFSASNAAAARNAYLQSARVRLREGFRSKGTGSCSSFSEGHPSSAKHSSSADPSQIGTWHAVGLGGVPAGGDEAHTGLNSGVSLDSGRASVVLHASSRPSTVYDSDAWMLHNDKHFGKTSLETSKRVGFFPAPSWDIQYCESSASCGTPAEPHVLEANLLHKSESVLSTVQRLKMNEGEQELTLLFQDKGLDPNFAMMYEETGIHPPLLALLQRTSLDADRDNRDNTEDATNRVSQAEGVATLVASPPESMLRSGREVWLCRLYAGLSFVSGTPERAWGLLSLVFLVEVIAVAIFCPTTVTIVNTVHKQMEFGIGALLLSPVLCSIMSFYQALRSENMMLSCRSLKIGVVAWTVCTLVGLLLSFLSKSSILLALSITVPVMVGCLVIIIPIWIQNGYQFCDMQSDDPSAFLFSTRPGCLQSREGIKITICTFFLALSIVGIGTIISWQPLEGLPYRGFNWKDHPLSSPYTSSAYVGWAVASAVALIITGALPVVSWFATYRLPLSSAICVGIFIVILVMFCGLSYVFIVRLREDQVPVKADFLAALLPLICIPAVLSLCCGLYKWRDEGWQLSRGVYIFLGFGLILLLGAISAVVATINPWMVGAAFLLFLLLLVLAVGVIHYWASHNFYLTRAEMFLVCLATIVLGLAAFLVGLLANEPFVGASVGYFSFLFLLAGRALTVLLSPPVIVYSPRVLPVYVYDAHADSAKNVSAAFLMLFGVAVAVAGWGVVASLEIYPPFAGAAASAITLVVAFGFAVSRPPLTAKMVEDGVRFLGKETVVQALARAATKTRNALSGTYSAPQRSASSTALLVGDPKMGRDKGGNYVLPRDDVLKLRERLDNQELAAGIWWCQRKMGQVNQQESSSEAELHAKIFLLEEALDTEWVYMWDKFGGYLLLLLGLAAKAERVQDDVRLRLFLESKGFSNLSERRMKKWQAEDYREFEMMQESFIREREMEDEAMLHRREEEGRGRERRRLLLAKEERRRRELEATVLLSIPTAGNKEVAAVAAAARAVACDILSEDGKGGEQVASIAQRVLSRQRAERAQKTGVEGAVCIVDAEPLSEGRCCGVMEPSVCGGSKVTFSAAVQVEVESGPVCLLGTEKHGQYCLEIFVSGANLAFDGGQVGLRLVLKGDKQTMITRSWNIGTHNLADGRWHTVTVTIDVELGEALTYLDGRLDELQSGLSIPTEGGVWQDGTEVWVGAKPPMDLDAFGRSDSEGGEPRMQIMDAFIWGRCLSGDEIKTVHNSTIVDKHLAEEVLEYEEETPSRDAESGTDPEDMDLYVREEALWEEHFPSGRKRRAEREFAVEMDHVSRTLRRPKLESNEEVIHRMLLVEQAVKDDLAARGASHFTDQEFPPSSPSLFIDPDKPSTKLQVVKEWMRPRDILQETGSSCEPCLFAGNADASNVCQGRLGDCWFLSALAVLTEASRIAEVIITPNYNDEGIYTVRFCIQGEWVPVVVDDWIPCEAKGKPAFATSRTCNELWVSILEKAYAKVHGSYEALEGGFVHDALVDLTGGAGEEIDMSSAQARIGLASGRLWSQLLSFKQQGFLLGAGSPAGSDAHVSSSGIVQGHAYSVLQVREVDGHKLIQVRNPWANEVEWNGPWSDLSTEWSDRMKHKLKYSPQAQDGVFWMSWEDFQIHFCSIYVCRIYPPEMRYSIRGQWRSHTAGGCQDYYSWHLNPQFRLRAVGPDSRHAIHVFITLTQGVHFSSRRRSSFGNYQSSGDSSKYFIGMRILQTRGNRAKYNIFLHESVGGTDYVNSREIAFEMVLDPAPKGYTIVPSTLHPGEEAPFLLSVFTKAAIVLEPL
ncbi:hypothetical protein L7F22_060797 [Adiantum nelumboides]|nr:hypothetical protein [Adiantum nelumboides]